MISVSLYIPMYIQNKTLKNGPIYQYFSIDYFFLKAKKTHDFKSCIVISVYQLDIPSIKKGTEYHDN